MRITAKFKWIVEKQSQVSTGEKIFFLWWLTRKTFPDNIPSCRCPAMTFWIIDLHPGFITKITYESFRKSNIWWCWWPFSLPNSWYTKFISQENTLEYPCNGEAGIISISEVGVCVTLNLAEGARAKNSSSSTSLNISFKDSTFLFIGNHVK